MKALSLWEPWASLMARGDKTVETRSWATNYRGPVLIHAAKKWDREMEALCETWPFADFLPHDWKPALGCAVAVAELVDCRRFTSANFAELEEAAARVEANEGPWTQRAMEFLLGDCSPGRYGWVFKGLRALPEPLPMRGAQGLWDVPEDVAQRVASGLHVGAA